MDQRKSKLKHAISAVCFLLIAAVIFLGCTYLYRTTKSNSRLNIVSMYNEEPNSLDMVIVGGSGIYRYWDGMRAYEESGVTSFSYACASMSGVMLPYAIDELLAHQNPKLIVVDGRRWLTHCVEELKENSIRFYLDSIDFNLNRLKGVWKIVNTYHLSFQEAVPYFIDLCLYHNNTAALTTKLNWQLADNRYDNHSKMYEKGFGMSGKIKICRRPPAEVTETISSRPLGERADAEFRKFMEYLNGLDAEVLLLFTPSDMSEEFMQQYNEMERIAAEYGIPTWNGNRYYDEMGIDFRTDFYNSKHTNINGAAKFTSYFLSYLKEHYDLPDHRALGDRPSWEAEREVYHRMVDETRAKYDENLLALEGKKKKKM